MKQSLQLKLGQQLVMTPQLQQAIKLLQLSTLDLQQEIQQVLDNNPMLEMSEEAETDAPAGEEAASLEAASPEAPPREAGEPEATELSELGGDIPSELPVDTRWEDVYQAPMGGGAAVAPESDLDNRGGAPETLRDHLLWQLNLGHFSERERTIAEAIIDATGDNGRLSIGGADILASFEPSQGVKARELNAVLQRVQQFDPPGVCTHDLRECLLVQLRQMDEDTPYLREARALVGRYMNLLGARDYTRILRRSQIGEDGLKGAMALIQSLNPNPGETISADTAAYIVPDVLVSRRDDAWVVELNPDTAPRLRINDSYASLVQRADNSAANTYMRDSLQEARWFLKSLKSRNETLMKVATRIVEHQRDFLEHGEEAMKPLVLHDIAAAVGMHESTISRVTTQKYMLTPRGIFELKYFFSSHVGAASGGERSSTAIRALVRKLIAAEDPRKPLSDNRISALLREQDIRVARRTIAKYRESLMIPPSNERKRLV